MVIGINNVVPSFVSEINGASVSVLDNPFLKKKNRGQVSTFNKRDDGMMA
jgi:hypothetical protein